MSYHHKGDWIMSPRYINYISGDSVALEITEYQNWGAVKNVSFISKYPAIGVGRRVTYVEISVTIFFFIQ